MPLTRLIPLLLPAIIVSPSLASAQSKLKVAIAANFLYAAREMEQVYEAENDVDIQLISASSGVLTSQILNQAPYDVFLSANHDFAKKIHDEGLGTDPVPFCQGSLALWFKDRSENENEPGSALGRLPAKSIAIPNPKLAPYGMAAEAWLVKHELTGLELVFAENVGQVNQYIYSASVSAAFTSASSIYASSLNNKGRWVLLEDADGIPHHVLQLNNSSNPKAAAQFITFLQSQSAQQILQKFGYLSYN